MEISTVYNCQDIGFECEPEKKQFDATQWIHDETVDVRLDSSCEDDAEGAEHRGCCIRNTHCDSESHCQEMDRWKAMTGVCDKLENFRQCLMSCRM